MFDFFKPLLLYFRLGLSDLTFFASKTNTFESKMGNILISCLSFSTTSSFSISSDTFSNTGDISTSSVSMILDSFSKFFLNFFLFSFSFMPMFLFLAWGRRRILQARFSNMSFFQFLVDWKMFCNKTCFYRVSPSTCHFLLACHRD